MSGDGVVAAARAALEAAYGLALEGLTDDQLATAIAGIGGAPADPRDARWLERLVDRLPIDESWLFRDDALWTWLRDDAGPELLRRAMERGAPVRILSLGCSAGQEPFSLAILLQGLLEHAGIPPSSAASYVSVVGVDSSPARIEAARTGAVPGWSVQRCRPDWLRSRVALEDAQLGRHRVDASVRAMCRFEVGNLVAIAAAGNAALGGYDLVLCRNVLIYFRAAEAERIAAELARGLDAGALLVVSAAEAHLLSPSRGATPVGPLGAGRVGLPGAPPPASAPVRTAHRRGAAARARRRLTAPAPTPVPARGSGPGGAATDVRVEAHVRVALEHAQAGRTAEVLREARAALFHDPRNLFSRLLLGQHLISVDGARGREVLHELLEATARLPEDASVPCAEGLSVSQLASAVRLLLARREIG